MLRPPSVPPSQYQPKHYHDRKLKNKEMDPAKFLKCLPPSGIQWVVEWWHIIGMVNHFFKDNCVPFIQLHCCFYYSPSCIARQFGERQGVPNDDGIFHISVFIERVLGRIHETWLKRMVAKDICFPLFLHPTSAYKTWLTDDMRSIHTEEKDYQKPNKRKRTN